jgi:ribosomal protein L37AE/L43A
MTDEEKEMIEILLEMKRTGKWDCQYTTKLFKYNNRMNFQYESSACCPPCVERVYKRLMGHFNLPIE